MLQDIPINFVREWFFEDVDEVGLELALLVGLLGLLGLLVADSQVLPRIWGNLTDLYSNGPRDVHVSSLGQTRSVEIEAKGSLWAQQVLLQIVSFASGIVWQRETAPFESYQRTKLSQNGRMEDPMLWAFLRIRSF